MNHRFTIVCIGEALFDLIGAEQRLGGSPLNVAVHAHQMLQAHELGQGVLVSRIGQDPLGNELTSQLRDRGMDVSFIQTDPDRPTGRVFVSTDADGQPTYEIDSPAAWDVMHYDPELEDLARNADAVAFGSLPQRDAEARNTIYRFLTEARRAVKLYDVNLRSTAGTDFYNRNILHRSCELATIVKLNDEELPIVGKLLGVDDAEQLRKTYQLEAVVLTRGSEGVAAATAQGFIQGAPAQAEPQDDADSVGAGDSCTAAILACRILNKPWQATLDYANRVGAFVVGQSGGTPRLPDSLINDLK